MLNIAICDDFEYLRERMVKDLKHHPYFTDAQFYMYEDGAELVADYEAGKYDLIFLDYYMQVMGGKRAAEKIRLMDCTTTIVYATSEEGAYADGYDVQWKIAKPFDMADIDNIIHVYEERCKEMKTGVFSFKVEGKKHLLKKDGVWYTDGKLFVFKDRQIESDEKLSWDKEGFYLTDNGFYLRPDKIKRLEWKKIIMENGDEIPLTFHDWWSFPAQSSQVDKGMNIFRRLCKWRLEG